MTFHDTNKENVKAALDLELPQTLQFAQRGGMVLILGVKNHTSHDYLEVTQEYLQGGGGQYFMASGSIKFLKGKKEKLQILLASSSQADRAQLEAAVRNAVQPTGKKIESMEFTN